MKRITLTPILCVLLAVCISSNQLSATTIVPFDNYAEMARAAKSVVLARMIQSSELTIGNNTYQLYEFAVESNVKGNLVENTRFTVKSLSFKTNDGLRFVVADDMSFEEGRSYMLALDDYMAEMKIPLLLNYAILEKVTLNNKEYLVPTPTSKKAMMLPTPSGKTPEPLIEVDKIQFLNNLKSALANEKQWNVFDSKADRIVRIETRAAPTGCLYLGDNGTQVGFRWQNNSSANPLRIWKESTGDLSMGTPATVFTYVDNAITALTSNYNISLSNQGTTTFTPTCIASGGGAASPESSSNFFSVYNALMPVNGKIKTIITFNDVCNSITNLSGCAGVLAYGGAYFGSPFHTFNGVSWYTAQYGYIVVNNGVGACMSGTNYSIMLEHELTHVFGMDHLDPTAYPNNNMNPSCCKLINIKDRECMDFAYIAQVLPVELTDFQVTANSNDKVNISWASATEINHKMYEIERSQNGKDFESIKQTVAKGDVNKAAQYSFIDETPYSGVSYYRLRMIGKNGADDLSKTLSVTFKSSKVRLKFYPNPVQDNVRIYIASPSSEDFNLDVFDVTGKLIWSKKVSTESESTEWLVDTHNWSKGVFFVKLSNEKTVITEKIMKY